MQKSQLAWKAVRELAKTQSPEEIVKTVLSSYNNVGVQQHDNLILFSVNNPSTIVLDTGSDESFALANRRVKRELNTPSKMVTDQLVEQTVSNQAGSSFVYCTSDNTVKHRFLRTARALDSSELAYFKLDRSEDRNKDSFVKMDAIPYGLMFQAMYVNDQWILASPNNCHLNDMKFGSDTTVMQKFEAMLKSHKFSLKDLNKKSVYTFILGCNEFSLFPLKKDYLFIKNIYTEFQEDQDSQKPDPLLKLRDSLLKPFMVNLENKSFTLIQKILKSRRDSWFYKLLDAGIPISYFIVSSDKVYQYSTPLFDRLWKFYTYTHSSKDQQPTLTQYMKTVLKSDQSLPDYLLKNTRPKLRTNKKQQQRVVKKQ